MMPISSLPTTLIGGFLVGFVFSIFKLPLPVPPIAGLVAAGACLVGSASYEALRLLLERSNG